MTKHFDIVHNTDEWHNARAGMATTSNFDRILTPGGDLSKSAGGYANQIIAELMLGRPIERSVDVYAMEWGRQHEADAANLYMFDTGLDVIHGGFFTNDEMTVGSSPDVIVLDGEKRVGIAEIKCPQNPAIHVEFLLSQKINPKYKPQLFGQMIVTGFDWVDWFSYYPGMPATRIRASLADDLEYANKMKAALVGFEKMVLDKLLRLQSLGHIEEIPKKLIREARAGSLEKNTENYFMAG